MQRSLLFLCGDPGGGRSLVPLLQVLSSQQIPFSVLAYSASIKVLSRHTIPFTHIQAPPSKTEIQQILKDKQPCGLVCATSMHTWGLEQRFTQAANEMGIPSLGVLDFWANYRMRFTFQGNLILPDMIAVMDELARDEMIQDGFPPEILYITGQPAFDEFLRRPAETSPGSGDDSIHIIYVSQPMAQYYPPDTAEYPGFDEHSVLQNLVSFMDTHPDLPIFLDVLLHPTQDASHFHAFRDSNVRIISDEHQGYQALRTCQLVTGMTSTKLFESALMGLPVLSLQPACSQPFHYPGIGQRVIPVVNREDDISREIKKMLRADTASSDESLPFPFDGKATQRVVNLILNNLQ